MLVVPVGRRRLGPKPKIYGQCPGASLVGSWAIRAGDPDSGLFGELSGLIDHCKMACEEMARTFRGTDFVMVMGQGRHYATALEGSLKITEMSGIPAAGFETEEAFHGRFHGLSGKSLPCS